MNLFEWYLSEISGLLIIENDLATADINRGKPKEAITRLINIIKKYDELKDNSSACIRDYNPAVDNQQIIIPSRNEHNLFYCESKIIELYGKVIAIHNDSNRILEYVQEINKRINYNFNYINLSDVSPRIPFRKLASLYITLGNTLLKLDELHIDCIEICSTIGQRFFLTDNTTKKSNLETAEQLFERAKSVSRNTDFTKADAYEGLIKLCQQKLRSKDIALTKENRRELLNEIEELSLKRDEINKQLNRMNKVKL